MGYPRHERTNKYSAARTRPRNGACSKAQTHVPARRGRRRRRRAARAAAQRCGGGLVHAAAARAAGEARELSLAAGDEQAELDARASGWWLGVLERTTSLAKARARRPTCCTSRGRASTATAAARWRRGRGQRWRRGRGRRHRHRHRRKRAQHFSHSNALILARITAPMLPVMPSWTKDATRQACPSAFLRARPLEREWKTP